jgi:hypothetical protein
MTLGKVVETFQVGGASVGLINAIRNEPEKEKRDELKKKIPAVVFGSEPQAERKNTACTPNGILCLDFDNIPKDELESAKKAIAAVPYVFVVGLSVSGTGIFALACYEGTPNLKNLLSAMQADFRYEIDKSRSDLCGLRFVTLDENMIVNDEVSAAILTEYMEDIPESEPESKPGKKIIGGCFADVKDELIDWLWKGRFARGHLHQFQGFPDSGKGYFSFWLAGVVTQGGTFPDGEVCKKGNVLIVGTEEHMGYAKRKLVAQGVDLRNVHYITGYTEDDEEHSIFLTNPEIIQDACDELKAAGLPVSLIIVDPLLQMLGVDSNDNGKAQAVLAPIKELAERNNVCFLSITHDGKTEHETAASRAIGANSM